MVALVAPAGGEVRVRIVRTVAEVVFAPERPAVIAVDMPIGLPDRVGPGGRAAEAAVRPLLGARQSSVFSVPSRAAVYAEIEPPADWAALLAAHKRASKVALATSDPPKKIALQAFCLFPKIRCIDGLLKADASLAARVFETHPEVAFWHMNGKKPLDTPKKVKGRPHPPGLDERRHLLKSAGLPVTVVNESPPKGAGPDDLLDALACAVTARRIRAGVATSFPNPPPRDAHGLRMAIWA
ncbi:putative RNase H-like nuclease [Rhodoplanes tepidamans]|nr:putative RNase H-like nuclease [Rhodoplanes tepidamans]